MRSGPHRAVVPPAGFEPTHLAPEASALSTELRGLVAPRGAPTAPMILRHRLGARQRPRTAPRGSSLWCHKMRTDGGQNASGGVCQTNLSVASRSVLARPGA